jgi:hypothetical protein
MSTPSKKKAVTKVPLFKPKYKIGGKVFFILNLYKVDEIVEGEITSIKSEEFPEKDGLGKVRGYSTIFGYVLETRKGQIEVSEFGIFPNYTEAAKEFAKSFLCLLR